MFELTRGKGNKTAANCYPATHARLIDILDSLADNLMASIFRLRFNNLTPFEKTGFVTS